MLGWIRQTCGEIFRTVSASESWSDFVISAAKTRRCWKYPVYVVDEIFERFRYMTGDLYHYPDYFWGGQPDAEAGGDPPWLARSKKVWSLDDEI